MDHKGGQRPPTEFRDEVLPTNTQNQMATKDNQYRSTQKNEGDNQCDARSNQEKNDNVRAHMQNVTGQTGKMVMEVFMEGSSRRGRPKR